jgi:RHS repeat-associated protein
MLLEAESGRCSPDPETVLVWRALAAATILALLVGVALSRGLIGNRTSARRVPQATTAPRAATVGLGALSRLPVTARGPISRALGRDDATYDLTAWGSGFHAVNPAQRLGVSFGRSGVMFSAAGTRLGLELRAVGYGTHLHSAGLVTPRRADGDRVVYAREGLSEWYSNGPRGVEQGFTVAKGLGDSGGEPLTLSMALSGDAQPSLAAHGQSVTFSHGSGPTLSYGGLLARDASGRTLHSWLQLQGKQVLLRVDTRGARLPLRIDPLVQQSKRLTAEFGGETGYSVALSSDGNTALIGVPRSREAVVFTRSGATWTKQAELQESEAEREEEKEKTEFVSYGNGVALSSDGNTALIVGEGEGSTGTGHGLVFTRSGSTWTKQAKLTGSESKIYFGEGAALSADGNTALIGGEGAWMFTRSGSTWTQQGAKMPGAFGFGASVALSGDGNTAMAGDGPANEQTGIVSVFTRSSGTWKKQGSDLTGPEEIGEGFFGSRVALSSDGSTALIGGFADNNHRGAAWIFTRSESKWQWVQKLTVSGESEKGYFGIAVALSYDGKTALVGSSKDELPKLFQGSAWVFKDVGGKWLQQGSKIRHTEGGGQEQFGRSVALSADGETGLIGAPYDRSNAGAAWAFSYAFDPEEFYGSENPGEPDQYHPCAGRPVNCATGNQTETQTDLTVGGRGPGLNLTRTYNSQLAASQSEPGPFGYGWTGPYNAHITFVKSCELCTETVTVYQDNGSTVQFKGSPNPTYVAPPWVQATLVKSGSNYVYTLPDQSKLTFNSAGLVTAEADRNGNAITMSRSSEGRLESVTDAAGRSLTFAYNEAGHVGSVKDPMGHTAKYVYESGNLTSVTEPGEENPRWKFSYGTSNQMTGMTDGRGHTVTTEYDSSHRAISQVDALERKHTWKYTTTESGSETVITEPNGSETVEQFNSAMLPTSITHAAGTSLAATTTYEYDSSYNLIAVTNPNGRTVKNEYDPAGDRTSTIDANGNQTKWTYNATHDVETMTTPKGEKTTVKRDSHGNPETIERPAPGGKTQKTTYKYDSQGDLTSEKDSLERTRTYEYDKWGDRESETDAEGDKRTYAYNEDSQETSTVSPRGNAKGAEASKFTTKTERDQRGRPTTITDPLGHTTKYTYDGDGNLETVTDGNGHKTTYTYNADDQQTAVKKPNGIVTETEYDNAGMVIAQTDGNKHTTKYVRNLLEQIVEEIDPLGRKTTKGYDLVGDQTKLTDSEKRTTTYAYDPGSRLIEVSYSDGKTHQVKYEYDRDGNRTGMSDGTGRTSYTFDQLDRPTRVTDGHGDSTSYEYDLANEQTKLTYPNKSLVTRTYDKAGRLQTVTDWLGHQIKLAYDPDSHLTATTFPTTTVDQDKYAYNEADQLSGIKMAKGTEALATLVYARDNDGQLKKTTSKGLPGEEAPEYGYDENNRLTKAGASAYEYDAANNPTKLGANTYTYNSADELETGAGGKYTYDELGERTKNTPASGPATTYAYNQAGELTAVERPAEGKTPAISDTYTYDGTGLRASQTKGKITSYLTWDQAEGPPAVLNDGTNSYVYGPGDVPLEQINSESKVLYLHHDQQGSTRLLTGSTGASEATTTYDAYGNTTGTTGTATTPLGYDGQYTNADTGLIYLRARAYDPATAQFISTDPLLKLTHTPYSYSANNPLTYGDPTGRDAIPLPIPVEVCAAGPEALLGCIIVGGAGAILGHEAAESIVHSITGEDESASEEPSEEAREREEECEQTNPEDSLPYGSKEPNAAMREISRKTGIPLRSLKNAFHKIKDFLPNDAKTRIDPDGNVYSSDTGENLGNIIDESHG